jgi:hypothetical protein
MTASWRSFLVGAALLLGSVPAMAQAGPGTPQAPRTYTCAADAHCKASCLVDGERQFQTGIPKETRRRSR